MTLMLELQEAIHVVFLVTGECQDHPVNEWERKYLRKHVSITQTCTKWHIS